MSWDGGNGHGSEEGGAGGGEGEDAVITRKKYLDILRLKVCDMERLKHNDAADDKICELPCHTLRAAYGPFILLCRVYRYVTWAVSIKADTDTLHTRFDKNKPL